MLKILSSSRSALSTHGGVDCAIPGDLRSKDTLWLSHGHQGSSYPLRQFKRPTSPSLSSCWDVVRWSLGWIIKKHKGADVIKTMFFLCHKVDAASRLLITKRYSSHQWSYKILFALACAQNPPDVDTVLLQNDFDICTHQPETSTIWVEQDDPQPLTKQILATWHWHVHLQHATELVLCGSLHSIWSKNLLDLLCVVLNLKLACKDHCGRGLWVRIA